jgi:hypothetical protein
MDETQADNQPRSEIVPVLIAALICDSAFQDTGTGKTTLIGVFDRVNARRFPSTHGSVDLFLKLVDADGVYDLEVKFVQVRSGRVLGSAKGTFGVKDRLSAVSMQIQFAPLPLPEEGKYEFQIWANAAYLGSVTLQAVLLASQEGPNG